MAGSDVETTRVTATEASIGRCRLMQVLVTSAGSGTPELKLTDGTDSGETKLHVDLQTGETDTISVPAQGILLETDINVHTVDDITSVVFFLSRTTMARAATKMPKRNSVISPLKVGRE